MFSPPPLLLLLLPSLSIPLFLSLSFFAPFSSPPHRLDLPPFDWLSEIQLDFTYQFPPLSPTFCPSSCSRNGTNNAVNVLVASGSMRFPVLVSLLPLRTLLPSYLERLTIPGRWSWREKKKRNETKTTYVGRIFKSSSGLNFYLVEYAKMLDHQSCIFINYTRCGDFYIFLCILNFVLCFF